MAAKYLFAGIHMTVDLKEHQQKIELHWLWLEGFEALQSGSILRYKQWEAHIHSGKWKQLFAQNVVKNTNKESSRQIKGQ
jgi:hypothetical protein